jgi:hypothetical protein
MVGKGGVGGSNRRKVSVYMALNFRDVERQSSAIYGITLVVDFQVTSDWMLSLSNDGSVRMSYGLRDPCRGLWSCIVVRRAGACRGQTFVGPPMLLNSRPITPTRQHRALNSPMRMLLLLIFSNAMLLI